MKILFVMRHPAAVRLLGSVLRLLDARGHEVHLAFRRIKTGESHRELQKLAEECPGITFGPLPARGSAGWDAGRLGWTALAEQLRHDSDFLRYLAPRYSDATELRARAEVKARPVVRRLGRIAGPIGARTLRRSIELVERSLQPPPHIERFVADQKPDVLLVTHLAEFGSAQTDYVRAARGLGIHTGYPVFSWDNLTNKGLVHDLPEELFVWNELQADEAVELQGIPRDRVCVTGSWAYDHWFDWKPSRSREDFCREVGLRADRPIVLYVCSSAFTAPDEVSFVRRWLKALRDRGGALGEAGVLVRLHPRNSTQWLDVSLDDPQAVIWPRLGEEPLDAASRQNYFDSIHHAAAVVGINTSAQIESAIVGRPVHTVLAEEFVDTQQGTLHFHYLQADEFGHLYVGRTMDEHLEQLEESLRGRDDEGRNERFLRRFVRPYGLDVAATPRFVEELEALAARPAPAPARGGALAPVLRRLAAPMAKAAARRHDGERAKREITPLDELRQTVRRLARKDVDAPVVAGPWLGDEIGELLYWIPFLRWAQVVTFGLRDRLVVVSRAASEPWYADIGSRHLREAPEQVQLPASLVMERRAEIAGRHPGERFLRRFLEFAPMPVPELPAGVELPDDFVAVRGDVAAQLGPTVRLDEHAGDEAAVIGRARGYVGPYGPEAYLAVLMGVPAVALDSGDASAEDIAVAASFLGEPPYGRLHVLEAARAGEAAALLEASAPAVVG